MVQKELEIMTMKRMRMKSMIKKTIQDFFLVPKYPINK